MLALVYVRGICEFVDTFEVNELMLYLHFASRVTYCTRSSVFCVHVGNEVTYFSGMPEKTVEWLYTVVTLPYSKFGVRGNDRGNVIVEDDNDNDLYVDSAQVVLDDFAERFRQFVLR